jgi:hypothetical protein
VGDRFVEWADARPDCAGFYVAQTAKAGDVTAVLVRCPS